MYKLLLIVFGLYSGIIMRGGCMEPGDTVSKHVCSLYTAQSLLHSVNVLPSE